MSSRKLGLAYSRRPSSYILDAVPREKTKLLTVRFDEVMYAGLAVAADVHEARSVSEHVHNFAVATIREAKKQMTEVEFHELVQAKLKEIEAKGKQKAKERRGLKGPAAKGKGKKNKAA